MIKKEITLILAFFILLSCSVRENKSENFNITHPKWSIGKVIYELNIRQFSEKGDFKSVSEQIPRLKKMGIGIIWLMPIHPIGEINRKGTLGSYYSVKDYFDVNSNFGSKDDFAALVKTIHDSGMYVIIDWVANHSSWDNPLIKEHPDWYSKDKEGNIISPNPDWHDVADFNYENPELRKYMISAMKYWVQKYDIDGYRCDVAELVPVEFWKRARYELEKIKPVFMLAEGEKPDLHESGFDMTYSWNIYHAINKISNGEKSLNFIDTLLKTEQMRYPKNSLRMRFISNHDENSWQGTVYERLDGYVKNSSVLCFTLPGVPLIYSGQEAGLNKRLNFFEKDPIDWSNLKRQSFYTTLTTLYSNHPSLYKGDYEKIQTDHDDKIFAYKRRYQNEMIYIILNFSKHQVSVSTKYWLKLPAINLFTNQIINEIKSQNLAIDGQDFIILKQLGER